MIAGARGLVAAAALSTALSARATRAGERLAIGRDLGAPLIAVERAVRDSALVVEGAMRRFHGRSSLALFRVATSLKGKVEPKRDIVVDFEKAPYGTWPKRGERAVLCLSKGEDERSYRLASYCASILPATAPVRSAIRKMAGTTAEGDEDAFARTEGGAALLRGDEPGNGSEGGTGNALDRPLVRALPRVEFADEYADAVAESETVLTGTLTDIRPSREGFTGMFRVEEAFVGYAGFKAPVRVAFVRPKRESRAAAPPSAGRYVLFLRGSERGDGFRVIPGAPSAVRVTDPVQEAKIKRAVIALAEVAAQGRIGLTTVQATLAEWQDSWNARDLARCILCYSAGSTLRRRYEVGGERRSSLAEQIKGFLGRAELSIRRVERSGVFAFLPGEAGPETATVTVILTLSADNVRDRRTAKMKFVREGREWLILEEGF